MQFEDPEKIEKVAFSMVVQAFKDYREQAVAIFKEEVDQPQDIAEDITREAIDAMGLSIYRDRIYGKVDVKKAIYTFLPEPQLVALMLDAKAEKPGGDRTTTIQMSQTSMKVKMHRSGSHLVEHGKLPKTISRDSREYYVVTAFSKFSYVETHSGYSLKKMILTCVPNGILQDRYNPDSSNTIWMAGRNAPTRGEDFRVRLDHASLRKKALWRVREISCE